MTTKQTKKLLEVLDENGTSISVVDYEKLVEQSGIFDKEEEVDDDDDDDGNNNNEVGTSSMTMNSVSLPYSASIIKNVVEFVQTDSCQFLCNGNAGITSTNIEGIVVLADAAEYLDMKSLKTQIDCSITKWMEENSCLHCPLLSKWEAFTLDCKKRDIETPSVVRDAVLQSIRKNPEALLNVRSGLASLTGPLLELILKDKNLQTLESTIFRILQTWIESQKSDPQDQSRLKEYDNFKHHVRLERIAVKDITKYVIPSGLYSSEELLQASLQRSSLLERTLMGHVNDGFDRRGSEFWLHYGNEWDTQCILSRLSKGNKYKWRIMVELSGELNRIPDSYRTVGPDSYPTVGIGVMKLTKMFETPDWIGRNGRDDNHCWILYDTGKVNGRDVTDQFHVESPSSLALFGDGSILQCELDLTSTRGKLSVLIEDGNGLNDVVTIADNIDPEDTYIPIVFMWDRYYAIEPEFLGWL